MPTGDVSFDSHTNSPDAIEEEEEFEDVEEFEEVEEIEEVEEEEEEEEEEEVEEEVEEEEEEVEEEEEEEVEEEVEEEEVEEGSGEGEFDDGNGDEDVDAMQVKDDEEEEEVEEVEEVEEEKEEGEGGGEMEFDGDGDENVNAMQAKDDEVEEEVKEEVEEEEGRGGEKELEGDGNENLDAMQVKDDVEEEVKEVEEEEERSGERELEGDDSENLDAMQVKDDDVEKLEEEEGGEKREFDGNGDENVNAMQPKDDGTRSNMLSTRIDHPTEKFEGCNNVSSIHEVDEKTLNSVTQTTSLPSELPELLDDKNIGNFAAEGASVLTATSQVYDQGTKSMYSGGKQSEASNLEELREIPKEKISYSVSEKPTLRRSRSPSADIALEPDSKRPAMLCDFFAKGWCIKGNSCRFLHQKSDVTENARRSTKSELPEEVSKVETMDTEGFREETERKSTSSDLRNSQTDEKSSPSHVLLQRALVRAYGDEKQGDKFPKSNVNDQNRFPLSSGHYHMSDEFSSSKSLLAKYPPVPEQRFSSSSSSFDPGVHRLFCNDKYALDRSLHGQRNQYEANTLNRAGIHPCDPILTNSFRHESSVAQTYAHQVNSYIRGYGSQSNGLLCKNDALDFGRRHFSGSYSSSGSYRSPSYHKDTLISLGNKSQYQNKSIWEPSMRFQSSFCPSAKVSSPGSQYDPLLDSIEPPKSSTQSPSRMSAAHTFPRESQSPLYNTQKLSETVSRLNGSNYIFGNGMQEDMSVVIESLFATDARKNGYLSNEDKNHSSSFVGASSIMQLDNNLRSEGDGNKQNKESKVSKIFRAALAEFVKDLLKPSWREGHLSKDAHKLIVKKAVEKVIGALQPHQIPSNTESTNQYFSNSRPKLLKLVEGYVEKYKSATQ